MPQYRRPHPYDARYALPPVVMAEAPGNNAMVTAYRPRGSYDQAPAGWDGGYALPDYVRAERPGGGAAFTYWPRRGTIPQRLPSSLAGFDDDLPKPGFPGDPIKAYGQEVAGQLVGSLYRQVPAEFRSVALKALLDEIDPALDGRVAARMAEYQERYGMGPSDALKRALASGLSEGLMREIGSLGQGVRPKKSSQVGLGWYDDGQQIALDGFWSRVKKAVSKVGSTIKKGAVAVGSGVKKGVYATGRGIKAGAGGVKKGVWAAGRGIKKGAVATGSAIKKASKQVYRWGKSAINAVGRAACAAVKSDVFKTAAAAGGSALGIPPQATVAGAETAGGICPSKKGKPPVVAPTVQPVPAGSSLLLPALGIAAVGLALALG